MPQIVARTPNMWTYESPHTNRINETATRLLALCRVSEMCHNAWHNAVCTLAVVATSPLLHRIHTFACISIFTQRLHVIFALLLLLLYQNFALLICTARSCFFVLLFFFVFLLYALRKWSIGVYPDLPENAMQILAHAHTHLYFDALTLHSNFAWLRSCMCMCIYIFKYNSTTKIRREIAW